MSLLSKKILTLTLWEAYKQQCTCAGPCGWDLACCPGGNLILVQPNSDTELTKQYFSVLKQLCKNVINLGVRRHSVLTINVVARAASIQQEVIARLAVSSECPKHLGTKSCASSRF